MASHFDLFTEPFIPCRNGDGISLRNLRDVLLEAHSIREIEDSSPLTTLALHRFLLAILHRALKGPAAKDDWKVLFEAGRFTEKPLVDYLEKWRERFDLFDPLKPFYQDASFTAKAPNGVNQLVRELSRGNNATLFDHTHEEPPPILSGGHAARAIITEQMFAVGGGKSELGYTSSGPAANGAMVLIVGPNLFETLMLNLIRYPRQDYFPTQKSRDDAPAWERNLRPSEDGKHPDGLCDYYTWASRSIRLTAEPDGLVQWMSYAAGRTFKPDGLLFDPMTAYTRDEKDVTTDYRPVRLSESRDLWRDSAAFFQFSEKAAKAPANLRWLRALKESGALPKDRSFGLKAIGLCTDKAKVNFWRQETLPLPLDYLSDEELVVALKAAIDLAGEVGDAVKYATAELARVSLTAGDSNRSPDKGRQWQIVDSIGADALYWSRLETVFRELMRTLPSEKPRDEAIAHRDERKAWWFGKLEMIAKKAYRESVNDRQETDRDRRAVIAGETSLLKSLGKLRRNKSIAKPEVAS